METYVNVNLSQDLCFQAACLELDQMRSGQISGDIFDSLAEELFQREEFSVELCIKICKKYPNESQLIYRLVDRKDCPVGEIINRLRDSTKDDFFYEYLLPVFCRRKDIPLRFVLEYLNHLQLSQNFRFADPDRPYYLEDVIDAVVNREDFKGMCISKLDALVREKNFFPDAVLDYFNENYGECSIEMERLVTSHLKFKKELEEQISA